MTLPPSWKGGDGVGVFSGGGNCRCLSPPFFFSDEQQPSGGPAGAKRLPDLKSGFDKQVFKNHTPPFSVARLAARIIPAKVTRIQLKSWFNLL